MDDLITITPAVSWPNADPSTPGGALMADVIAGRTLHPAPPQPKKDESE